jgi:hypothetical protein
MDDEESEDERDDRYWEEDAERVAERYWRE